MRRLHVLAALVLALAPCALPSVIDDIVGQVTAASYQHYLDDRLYAHSGDNRGLGGAQHDLARTNIYDDFVSLGLTTSLDTFLYGGSTYSNVVATLPGVDPTAGTYILGAHYDSVGNPGADDNASGVAGVLEAARVLSRVSFASTLVFIAFDREEQGLIGSGDYASRHRTDDIRGMVSLDMISYNSGNRAVVVGAAGSDSIKGRLAAAAANPQWGNLPVTQQTAMDCCSDHRSFENYGFQAALLIEYYSANPYYHSASDSIDTSGYIDYNFAAAMTKSAVGFLADEADPVPEPPTAAAGIAVLLLVAAARRRALIS